MLELKKDSLLEKHKFHSQHDRLECKLRGPEWGARFSSSCAIVIQRIINLRAGKNDLLRRHTGQFSVWRTTSCKTDMSSSLPCRDAR